MRLRPAALVALLAVPLTGLGAHAAPRLPKVCQLVVDPANDLGFLGVGLPVDAPSLDITSADIATGPKSVTGALRLRSLRPDAATASGAQYSMGFLLNGVEYGFRLVTTPEGGAKYTLTSPDVVGGTEIAGRIDAAAATIYFVAERKMLPRFAGATFSGLLARAALRTGTQLDGAQSTKTYVDRQPSCVPST